MVDITDRGAKCYAMVYGQCTVLIRTNCTNCAFYKPEDCEDWVRVDKNNHIYLLDPDEYETRRRKDEQLQQRKNKFYRIVKQGAAANDEL